MGFTLSDLISDLILHQFQMCRWLLRWINTPARQTDRFRNTKHQAERVTMDKYTKKKTQKSQPGQYSPTAPRTIKMTNATSINGYAAPGVFSTVSVTLTSLIWNKTKHVHYYSAVVFLGFKLIFCIITEIKSYPEWVQLDFTILISWNLTDHSTGLKFHYFTLKLLFFLYAPHR